MDKANCSMMNTSNLLTLGRIILTPICVFYLVNQKFETAFFLFVIAAVSDALDGAIARWFDQTTIVGTFLDPIADKLLIAAASIVLAMQHIFPEWLAILVIGRDIIIVLGIGMLIALGKQVRIRPHIDSKLNTCLQVLTIGYFLGKEIYPFPSRYAEYLPLATAIFTIVSGVRYIVAGFRMMVQ